MIETNKFDYAQYYQKTIDMILSQPNAFEPLKQAIEFISLNLDVYDHMVKSLYNFKPFTIVLDATKNSINIGQYSTNCVALNLDYNKKNTKLNKLLGNMIKENSWDDNKDEFIKLIHAYFNKEYKKIYEKQLNNQTIDSIQYKYFPTPFKNKISILDIVKNSGYRITDMNRNWLDQFEQYFNDQDNHYSELFNLLKKYDVLDLYELLHWIKYCHKARKTNMPMDLYDLFIIHIQAEIKSDLEKNKLSNINDLISLLNKTTDSSHLITFIKKELGNHEFSLLYNLDKTNQYDNKRFIKGNPKLYSGDYLLSLTTYNKNLFIYGIETDINKVKKLLMSYKLFGKVNQHCHVEFIILNEPIPDNYQHYILNNRLLF